MSGSSSSKTEKPERFEEEFEPLHSTDSFFNNQDSLFFKLIMPNSSTKEFFGVKGPFDDHYDVLNLSKFHEFSYFSASKKVSEKFENDLWHEDNLEDPYYSEKKYSFQLSYKMQDPTFKLQVKYPRYKKILVSLSTKIHKDLKVQSSDYFYSI